LLRTTTFIFFFPSFMALSHLFDADELSVDRESDSLFFFLLPFFRAKNVEREAMPS